MKSRELQKLWWDWLSTSERLLRSLYEQTAALTLRDVARVERIQPDLDHLRVRLQDLDEEAVACVHSLAGELGTQPNLRSISQALEKAEAQQLLGLANRVTVAARNVQAVVDKNKVLIDSEMMYVNGTLALIAKAAVDTSHAYGSRTAVVGSVVTDQAA